MGKRFLKFADLPPNPFNAEDLKDYKELGMNVCLLTEDDVKMVVDGNLSEGYKQAIQHISETTHNNGYKTKQYNGAGERPHGKSHSRFSPYTESRQAKSAIIHVL